MAGWASIRFGMRVRDERGRSLGRVSALDGERVRVGERAFPRGAFVDVRGGELLVRAGESEDVPSGPLGLSPSDLTRARMHEEAGEAQPSALERARMDDADGESPDKT